MRKLKNEELQRISVEAYKKLPKIPIVIVLDNIRSQQNIGSVFRTADAFRLEAIHLCGITATPPHREIHRTALGATESVEWQYFPSTTESIHWLRQNGYRIIGIEQTDKSIDLNEFHPIDNQKMALVYGNEINGLEDAILPLLDDCLEIPQWGTKHSLNIAVSAGVVVWDIVMKMKNIL